VVPTWVGGHGEGKRGWSRENGLAITHTCLMRKSIAAVLSPRLGAETVCRHVEVLYMQREFHVIDKLNPLIHNPYRAVRPVPVRDGGRHQTRASCGRKGRVRSSVNSMEARLQHRLNA